MDLTAEAISKIEHMTEAALKTEVLTPDSEASDVYFMKDVKDGQMKRHVADPLARRHQPASIGDLVAATKRLGDGEKSAVWFDCDGITVLLDDAKRRDIMRMPLTYTKQFEVVRDSIKVPRNQAQFVRLLRIDLAGTIETAPELLERVRNIKYGHNAQGDRSIQPGKESISTNIKLECLGVEALPDEVVLSVRVYDGVDFHKQYPVRCALDVLVEEEMFRLVPLPNQLEDTCEAALDDVGTKLALELADAKVPVFRGDPFPS